MKYGRLEMLEEQLVHEEEKLKRLEKDYLIQRKWVKDMKKEIQELKDIEKAQKKCPRCGNIIQGYPAISRKDNKTEICSACGTDEAMEAFNNYHGLK